MKKDITLDKALLSVWRGNEKDDPLNKSEVSRVGRALLNLQRGLTGNRNLVGVNYMQDDASLGAYLLYYYRITHRQITLAFDSFFSKTALKEKSSIRILDVGSGPGPASMALVDSLIEHGVKEDAIAVDMIDVSAKALTLAKALFYRVHPKTRVSTKVTSLEKSNTKVRGDYEIIVASHVLNELWKKEPDARKKRAALLNDLSKNLSEAGVLLISEPALTETSRATLSLIPALLEMNLRLIAPCPEAINETRSCPLFLSGASDKATCHASIASDFSGDVLRLANAAQLTREEVKMTFLALLKPKEERKGRKEELRIVSDAMLNKSGRIRYLLCDGKKRFPISAKADSIHAKEIGFFQLKRYDTIEITNPEIRGDAKNPALGIEEKTCIKVHAFASEARKGDAKLLQVKRHRHESSRRKNCEKNKSNPLHSTYNPEEEKSLFTGEK